TDSPIRRAAATTPLAALEAVATGSRHAGGGVPAGCPGPSGTRGFAAMRLGPFDLGMAVAPASAPAPRRRAVTIP
ncbi:MAG: hypothetical protein U0031_12460, partial [Thermomicrobiales bacterium]